MTDPRPLDDARAAYWAAQDERVAAPDKSSHASGYRRRLELEVSAAAEVIRELEADNERQREQAAALREALWGVVELHEQAVEQLLVSPDGFEMGYEAGVLQACELAQRALGAAARADSPPDAGGG